MANIPINWTYMAEAMLVNPDFALPLMPGADANMRNLLVLGLLTLTLLVQMFALRKPDEDGVVAAPVSFSVGILFALLTNPAQMDPAKGMMTAGLATLVAVAGASGIRSWHGFFLGAIIGLAPGYLLLGGLRPLLWPVLLLFVPVLVNLLCRD